MIKLKSPRELDIMKEAGEIVARCHARVRELLEPGMTTLDLDREVEKLIHDFEAKPAFKNYRGYPASICTSINEEIVHGIPSDREIEEGDILSIDIGVEYRNYFGDAARTHPIGQISESAQKLVQDTREALDRAMEKLEAGQKLSNISKFVESFGTERGYEVVRDYVGHGIGQDMHEDPQIPNFYDPEQHTKEVILKEGMVLALEPMLNIGTYRTKKKDDWTVVTEDGELSAHFEDTVAITPDGIKILTRLEDGDSTFSSFEQN